MKRVIFLVVGSSFLFTGCKKANETSSDSPAPSAAATAPAASKPAPAHAAPSHGAAKQPGSRGMAGNGKVKETMNAGGYTYVLLDGQQGEVWAAAPQTTVKVGDEVSFSGGMPMKGFRSNTLNRSFDMVYFVPGLSINGAAAPAPKAKAAVPAMGTPAPATGAIDLSGIAKADGGKRIEEIFAGKAELGGQQVLVRGKVVKFNGGIMGRNWIHIQDGSGTEGTNDLTVTTDATVPVGATILVKGTVGLEKNFGGGYQYNVIVEGATVTVE